MRMFNVNPATIVVVSQEDSEYLHLGNELDGYFQIHSVSDEGIVLCDGLTIVGSYNEPRYRKQIANEVGMKAFNTKLEEYRASAKNKENIINKLVN